MDTYADNLAVLTEHLDLKEAIHVPRSTGVGEVDRHIGRHETRRMAMAAPIGASALMSAKVVKNATLKSYSGFSHGMCTTNPAQIDADLLAFFRQSKEAAA